MLFILLVNVWWVSDGLIGCWLVIHGRWISNAHEKLIIYSQIIILIIESEFEKVYKIIIPITSNRKKKTQI